MSNSGTAIDVLSPTTFEDIEERIPDAEHTGNRHRVIEEHAFDVLARTTISGRRAFEAPLAGTVRQFRSRTSTFDEAPGRLERFWDQQEQTWVEDMPDYSATATVIFLHGGTKGEMLVRSRYQLPQRLRREIRKRLAHGQTASIAELLKQVSGYLPENFARSLPVPWFGFIEAGEPDVEEGQAADTVEGASVADLTSAMRRMVELPVQDLAQMCGLGRRHYYNLMKGDSQPPNEQESRLRQLHKLLAQLYEALGENPEAVRAAILTPLLDEQTSFYDIAREGDTERTVRAFEQLRQQLAKTKPDYRALPPSGRLPSGAMEPGRIQTLVGSRGIQPMRGGDDGQ